MTTTEQERERVMSHSSNALANRFTYMLSSPQWRCKIGRVTLKCGVTMHVPFNCFDWFA